MTLIVNPPAVVGHNVLRSGELLAAFFLQSPSNNYEAGVNKPKTNAYSSGLRMEALLMMLSEPALLAAKEGACNIDCFLLALRIVKNFFFTAFGRRKSRFLILDL